MGRLRKVFHLTVKNYLFDWCFFFFLFLVSCFNSFRYALFCSTGETAADFLTSSHVPLYTEQLSFIRLIKQYRVIMSELEVENSSCYLVSEWKCEFWCWGFLHPLLLLGINIHFVWSLEDEIRQLGSNTVCAFKELYPIQRTTSNDYCFFFGSLKTLLFLFTACHGIDPKWPQQD